MKNYKSGGGVLVDFDHYNVIPSPSDLHRFTSSFQPTCASRATCSARFAVERVDSRLGRQGRAMDLMGAGGAPAYEPGSRGFSGYFSEYRFSRGNMEVIAAKV